jgi:hypothetical protein
LGKPDAQGKKPYIRVHKDFNITNNGESDDFKYDVDNSLNDLPLKDTKGIKNVVVEDYRKMPKATTRGFEGRVAAGYYDVNTETIVISDQQVKAGMENTNKVLYHEVGHHVFSNLSSENQEFWVDTYPKIQTLMPNDYAKTNYEEGFAESYGRLQSKRDLDVAVKNKLLHVLER